MQNATQKVKNLKAKNKKEVLGSQKKLGSFQNHLEHTILDFDREIANVIDILVKELFSDFEQNFKAI